jgi:hypothetical protein
MFRLMLIAWVVGAPPSAPVMADVGTFRSMQECQQAAKSAWLQDNNRAGFTSICVSGGGVIR